MYGMHPGPVWPPSTTQFQVSHLLSALLLSCMPSISCWLLVGNLAAARCHAAAPNINTLMAAIANPSIKNGSYATPDSARCSGRGYYECACKLTRNYCFAKRLQSA